MSVMTVDIVPCCLLPGNEYVVSVSDCAEGTRLLKAASQPNSRSVTREAFLEHIKHCPVCHPSNSIVSTSAATLPPR
jgi:hypothetical protein